MALMRRFKMLALSGLVIGLLAIVPGVAEESGSSDEKQVINAYNTTGLQLYRELGQKPGNIVISPYSIGTAMSMALAGARGGTEREMAGALNFSIPRERVDAANSGVLDAMDRYRQGQNVELLTANALCLTTHGDLVQDAYIKLLRDKYRAELFSAQDIGPINAWVSEKTHNKIDRILEQLHPNSVCVLLNAVYFKGLWSEQFDKKLTRRESFFTTDDGKALSVPMMRRKGKYALSEYDDFTALSMPYKDHSLSMVIILPKERTGLAKVEKKLSSETVQSVLSDLEKRLPAEVALSLPRFKTEFEADVIPAFKALGMELAFSDTKADFGGITGHDNKPGEIWINQIRHKAFLEVNEEGSEAAAATAVEFATRSASLSTQFKADHPFMFLLAERSTGAVLFMGRVNNPQ